MSETSNANSSPLIRKLDEIAARFGELERSLNDPQVLSNPQRLIPITKEKGKLDSVVRRYREYRDAARQVAELREMIANKPADAEMAELAQSELPEAEAKASALLESIKDEFVAAEDNAVDSFFLEIRAGTGGEEAALFARDLFEMYRRHAETKGWRFEVSDFSPSDRGGFKEIIATIKGAGAYRHLQFEGGGHRVQRVPETEA